MMQSLPEQSLKTIFKNVSEGDVSAFRILFDAYNKRLFAAAFKLTKSQDVAEDLVQEVFTALWEGRQNLSEVINPEAYLFTIAYNKTHRYLKKVASDSRLLETLKKRMSVNHSDTEEWLEVKETRQIIDQEVEKLPSKRQLIYRLSRIEGLTHQQIADQLNISPLTVKKQIVLALRQIRAGLANASPVIALFVIYIM